MTNPLADLSFEPLTPVSYLDRAAAAHGDRVAVVDGDQRWTYRELHARCRRLAGALAPLAQGRPVAVRHVAEVLAGMTDVAPIGEPTVG